MSLPIISVAGNGLLSDGHRFQIKGVDYAERTTGSTPIDVLADSRASQCAIDGPMMKALGVNTINVYYTDATQSHDKCMKIFQDNGIYVIANMASPRDSTPLNRTGMHVSSNIVNFTWQMDVFKQYAAVLDSMAGYSNLLGLLIGSEIVAGPDMEDQGSTVHLAPYLKAAARDMKAYTAAMQYRSIPIGYATSAEYTYMQDLGEYLVCGGNSAEAIDFYSVNTYQWRGKSSMGGSRYDDLTSKLESLAVPIFLSEDGCNIPVPQLLRNQSSTFEPNMPSIWSGAIVYEWREEGSNDGLVSYTTSGVSTPTTLAGYDALKSKWSAVPANTQPPSTFSSLSCPTSINPHWSINPSAALPTIAGLDFATITPVGVIGTAHGTRTLTSRSTPSSNPKSKHDVGVMAGIGVGVGLGVVLIFAAVITFFVQRHRKRRAINTGSSVTETSDTLGAGIPDPSAPLTEMSHTAPSGDLVYAGSPSGLPGSDLRSQELNSVVAHKVHKEEV